MRRQAIWRRLSVIASLFRAAAISWEEDDVWRLGAALSYFTVFSIGPLLIIVIMVAGIIFGETTARQEVFQQAQMLVGLSAARTLDAIIANARSYGASLPATLFGVVMLLFGASAVFVQLKGALNTIWGVEEKPVSTLRGFVRNRLLSFAMILSIGFLLLVSLIASALLAVLSDYLNQIVPRWHLVLQLADFTVSFGLVMLLIALIFKILPDVRIGWQDVWIGAAVTSLLFTIGKVAIGVYLGNSSVDNTFGAANSLVVIMLWTFYSSQIVLFGAEFTRALVHRRRKEIVPASNAVRVAVQRIEPPAE